MDGEFQINTIRKNNCFYLAEFEMFYDNMSVFNIWIYMYVHLEIIHMETGHLLYGDEQETSTQFFMLS